MYCCRSERYQNPNHGHAIPMEAAVPEFLLTHERNGGSESCLRELRSYLTVENRYSNCNRTGAAVLIRHKIPRIDMEEISPKGVIFEHYWQDEDVIEVTIYASNGAFGGTTNVYVGHGRFSAMAAELSGFPKNADDKRSFTLGAFGKQYAGGAVSMAFKCTNRAAHACVEIAMESDDEAQSSTFAIPIAAFEVDEFVRQLSAFESTRDGRAVLASGTLQTRWP